MHLKSLTLRGFKSFASATTLRLEPGITCVVGPNGSGKSNVVDALSWVMGEQGAKSLRGGKMEDVIFAGTTGRAPLGRAEVALTIDNTDGALPIEYSEVTISRTMFRNGGSEYAINGSTCRLLDIQELLSDSGIGREMHVIVGQGQLDSVLHADPMGRRAFIEEAAGVLKHRKRKEKALRKLDAMQANMTRVQDLVGELRRQLKPLGRQAQIARRAATIQADLRDARLRLLADDLVTLRRAVEEEVADEMALRLRRGGVEQEAEECRRREAVLEAQVAQLGPRVEQAQQTWFALSSQAERVRGTIGLAEARHRHATAPQTEERRGRDPEELEREAARVRAEEAELAEALEEAQYTLAETVERRAELERQLQQEEQRLRAAARALADRREGLARLQGKVAAARSRAVGAAEEIGRLAEARDAATARAALATEEYEQLKAQVDGLDAGDAEAEQQLVELRAALAEAEEAQSRAREELAAVERERAGLTARRDALALGLRRKDGSGALLGGSVSGVLGPAAELLTVRQGAEAAVAAALGHAADAVAVTGVAEAAEALRLLRKDDAGRAALLIADAPAAEPDRSPLPDGAVRVADLLSGPAGLLAAAAGLLRDTVLVDTLADAEALVAARPELTAVTAEGDLLSGGFGYGGSAGAPSLLETRAAVDEAGAALEALAGRREALAAALEQATARRKALAAEVEALAARRRAADKEKSAVAQQLGRLGGQARGATGEAERLTAAAAKAGDAREQAEQELAELSERLLVAEEGPNEEEPDTGDRDRLGEESARARQSEMEARLAVRTHEERVRGLAGRADSLDRGARAEREARARAAARQQRLGHEARIAAAVRDGARLLLARVEASLQAAAAEKAEAEQQRAARDTELGRERLRSRELKAELDKLTDSVHRDEVLRAEKRLRIEQLETKALEEHGIEAEGLLAEYGPDQLVPPSLAPADPDAPEAKAEGEAKAEAKAPAAARPYRREEQERRLRAAEKAYAQLGKVNPLALEEFAALEERHQFLGEQLEDLKSTRRDLLTVVKEVDERVEQVFTAAYHDTAREFEGVFSRLFPGGEGRLVLTDPENMLTTGIDVEARPPGKKVKRLSLLSGGERSLTAVALLVSIFKARPSPFYVMDEVEAALDETNLRRLIAIMEELRDSSQLIVITHQKLTMECADALYGVSMRGDGISQVISQRLRETPRPAPRRLLAAQRRPEPGGRPEAADQADPQDMRPQQPAAGPS
ncbi:chromosome segregation protein SMC [Streptacidiphilus sp. P02-A3a]|uniref:chromosome segregation protein SMC n=1 Tax=Streptacidiphilus sp. P02-A3a TaxID=2704468 RepID=UPI0015F8F5D9|nr:chromosome segregation protein SMC [Streptacidiphilus sp. P02-A3a]QMU72347.1 chromosome segregation protein SMC [Streptacidiphilus sp. P02-A3a]